MDKALPMVYIHENTEISARSVDRFYILCSVTTNMQTEKNIV